MQVVLLIELCFEILFLFLRCFAERDDDDDDSDPDIDVSMRGYIFVRAIYTVPVLGLNGGIYWIGGGPTGACTISTPPSSFHTSNTAPCVSIIH